MVDEPHRLLNVLFVHTRFPGQYLRLASAYHARGHRVRAIAMPDPGGHGGPRLDGVPVDVVGDPVTSTPFDPLDGLTPIEASVRRSEAVAAAVEAQVRNGFLPDIVYAHSGWGAGQFLKDVLPGVPVVKYFEWYYNNHGGDADFQAPDRPLAARLWTRSLDLPLLSELAAADVATVPTRYQASQFPPLLRDRLRVVPDGVDIGWFSPDPDARLRLADGRSFSRADKLVTYVARGADPYRGFRPFVEAITRLQRRDPEVVALVAGDAFVHYGPGAGTDDHFREVIAEVRPDPSRLHFVGRLPLKHYRRLLQVSAVHVHLSAPFVLSWSLLEAMASGCTLVASEGMPLDEVLADGENALLTPFDDPALLSARIGEALAGNAGTRQLGAAARRFVARRYSLARSLSRHRAIAAGLIGEAVGF